MKNMKKAIVIEDDPAINELIAYNLKQVGFYVARSYDGMDAKKRLETEEFNFVILDIMLPGISGFDICKDFKGSHENSKTFLIVVSAKCDYQDKLYAHILGADYYITKPFSIQTLLNVIKELEAAMDKEFTVRLPQ